METKILKHLEKYETMDISYNNLTLKHEVCYTTDLLKEVQIIKCNGAEMSPTILNKPIINHLTCTHISTYAHLGVITSTLK